MNLVLGGLCVGKFNQYAVCSKPVTSRWEWIVLTLVDVGLVVVSDLVELVSDGVLCSSGAGAEAGVVVLGDVLVGLLGSLRGGALDGLGNVVGGVLDGLHCDLCLGLVL